METEIRLLPLSSLKPSAYLELCPTMGQTIELLNGAGDAERRERLMCDLEAFRASVARDGVLEPLKVQCVGPDEYEILDGRERYAAAVHAGLEQAPCLEVDTPQEALLHATVVGRRHWTKGMKAWLAVKMCPGLAFLDHGGTRRGKQADQVHSVNLIWETCSLAAEATGVSTGLMNQACQLYAELYKPDGTAKPAAALIEPKVWLGHGLGTMLSGAGGQAATKDQARRPSGFYSAQPLFKSLASRCRDFDAWPAEQQAHLQAEAEELASALPAALRAVLAKALAAEGGK
jgi:hypothetical protein